jgi:hypothetical protein
VEEIEGEQSDELKAALPLMPEKRYTGNSRLMPLLDFVAGADWAQIVSSTTG